MKKQKTVTKSGKLDGRSKETRAAKERAAFRKDVERRVAAAQNLVPNGGTGYRGTYVPLDLESVAAQPTASARQVGGDHYQKSIQPWDAMQAWLSPSEFQGFLRGNAIKYLARCNDKGGVEDIKKAQHYLEKLIEVSGG